MSRGSTVHVDLLTHATPDVGLGHLNRCVVLYDALARVGAAPRLVLNDHRMARRRVGDRTATYASSSDRSRGLTRADLTIVDSYEFDERAAAEIQAEGGRVVLIDDDRFTLPSHVDGIVNPNVYAAPDLYPGGTFVLAGADYVLVRGDLERNGAGHGEAVFLCTGGSDPENQTIRLAKILLGATDREVRVVLGPGYEKIEAFDEIGDDPRLVLEQDPEDIGSVMKRCRYAVSGAGSMLYELAYMGLPTACMVLAENQARIASEFERRAACLNLGRFDRIADRELERRLQRFDADEDARIEVAARARELVPDGSGRHLAEALVTWIGEPSLHA